MSSLDRIFTWYWFKRNDDHHFGNDTGMVLPAHERISDISAFFLSNNAYWGL